MVKKCGLCGGTIKGFRGYDPEYGPLCLDCYKRLFDEEGNQRRQVRSFGYMCLPKDWEKR